MELYLHLLAGKDHEMSLRQKRAKLFFSGLGLGFFSAMTNQNL